MKSKILAAIPDPASPSTIIFIAESAGFVRRVKLDVSSLSTRHNTFNISDSNKYQSSDTKTYRGPQAPVTCVAIGGKGGKTIFAGSWDKDIWTWDIDTATLGRKLSGHSDFVKTLICSTISGKPILISGGADKKIMVWDTENSRRLHVLQDPSMAMMAVQHLAIDPILSTPDAVVFASAGSDPHIRRWKVTLSDYEQLTESFKDKPDTERLTIEEHETSVYKLVYDDTDEDGDLWTASADGTAKCLARSMNFVEEDRFEHGDYVRAVIVTEEWVITAGRNEDIKVWYRSSGKLFCTLEGHFEEVTDLILLRNTTGRAENFCSVSIDHTIRTWPLSTKGLDEVVQKIEEAKKPNKEAEENTGEGLLSAEEEAELTELMMDD